MPRCLMNHRWEWGPPPSPNVREGRGTLPRVPAKKSCIGRARLRRSGRAGNDRLGGGGQGVPTPLVDREWGDHPPPRDFYNRGVDNAYRQIKEATEDRPVG